jgi:antitoxin VapB
MAVQIANPDVVRKIEWLAATLNTSKTAAVERALDALTMSLSSSIEIPSGAKRKAQRREDMLAVLTRMHQTPVSVYAIDPLQWDENGLPI